MPWVIVKDTSVYRVDFYIERQEARVGDRLRYTIRVQNKTNRSQRFKFHLQRRTSANVRRCYRCCDERYTTLDGACTATSGCCSSKITLPAIDIPAGQTREYNLNWTYWDVIEDDSLPDRDVQWCWYVWIYYYDGTQWRFYGGRRAACVTVRARTPNVEVLTCYASPSSVNFGDRVTLTGSAMTADRLPLANVPLTVRINNRNYITVRTDSNGRYRVNISVTREYFNEGRNTIQVVAQNNRTCTSYVSVTVPTPTPPPEERPPEQPPTPPPEEEQPVLPPEEEMPVTPPPEEVPQPTPTPTPTVGINTRITLTLNFSLRNVPVVIYKNGEEVFRTILSKIQPTQEHTETLQEGDYIQIVAPRRAIRLTYDQINQQKSIKIPLKKIGLLWLYNITVSIEVI